MTSPISSQLIEIVSATRLSEAEFWEESALGRSLSRLAYDTRLSSSIAFSNRLGLPVFYNSRILAESSKELLVFVHDDVWIDDYFLVERVIDGLREYDVIGLAGNRRRAPNQALWSSIQTDVLAEPFVFDDAINLSGAVAHGSDACAGSVTFFGPSPSRCELLDGVFLAARKTTLTSNSLLFDPRFDFHFYDLDFCRAAVQRGLRLGTWPIAVTHQSGGNLGSQWAKAYRVYLGKWGA
jgi:GT2 family glycosyltransferase